MWLPGGADVRMILSTYGRKAEVGDLRSWHWGLLFEASSR